MHDIGCARSNYWCNECEDIVPKSEKEDHEKEVHIKVPCKYCSEEFKKRLIESHEKDCKFQPQQCEFCE